MDISQLAQELLDKGGDRVSVCVKVCVNKAKKARHTSPSYDDDDDEEDVEDDEPMPAKSKMSNKPSDDDEEDIYADELDDQYEIDLEGKKPTKR